MSSRAEEYFHKNYKAVLAEIHSENSEERFKGAKADLTKAIIMTAIGIFLLVIVTTTSPFRLSIHSYIISLAIAVTSFRSFYIVKRDAPLFQLND